LKWEYLFELATLPVKKELVVDVMSKIDYEHDQIEGIWLKNDGAISLSNGAISLSNNDDFNIIDENKNVEQKYLDINKTIEDTNSLYMIEPKSCEEKIAKLVVVFRISKQPKIFCVKDSTCPYRLIKRCQ
jgi:hypothetical protein|tara:strand:- start:787 stop:1176 length:390 start_codon:yes stop_codon:yes gene_type:complete